MSTTAAAAPGRPIRHWTEDEVGEAEALLRQGVHPQEAADRVGRTLAALRDKFRRRGLGVCARRVPRPAGVAEREWRKLRAFARRLYWAGECDLRCVASNLGLSMADAARVVAAGRD